MIDHDKYICIVLYRLSYDLEINDLFVQRSIQSLKNEYSYEEKKKIQESISWSLDNKDVDLKSFLPNISNDNSEIREYLQKLSGRF